MTKQQVNYTNNRAIVDKNRAAFISHWAAHSGKPVHHAKYYSWSDFRPLAWGSLVFNLNFPHESIDSKVKDLYDKIKSGDLPNMVFTGSSSMPENIGEYLMQAGFTENKKSPGMMLADMDLIVAMKQTSKLDIQIVNNDDAMKSFTKIVGKNLWQLPDDKINDAYVILQKGYKTPFAACFLGFIDAVPAAASAIIIDQKIGGIYMVAVDTDHRKKGFGAEMTIAAIKWGVKQKMPICVLYATDLGYPVYEKLGFKTISYVTSYKIIQ